MTAQLDNAQWELDQTTVRAPTDGYVSTMALTVGHRLTPLKSAWADAVNALMDMRVLTLTARCPDYREYAETWVK